MSASNINISKHVVQGILQAQKAQSCAYRVEFVQALNPKHSFLQDYVTAGEVNKNSENMLDADVIFPVGSGSLIVHFALWRIMVNTTTALEDEVVQSMMREAWNVDAFALYNKLRLHRGLREWKPPHHRPSIHRLMTHSKAYLAHTRGLFGPDGTFLMSEGTFGRIFADLVDNPSNESTADFCCSDWNTMLLGFIIRHATGQTTLANALKVIVLDYCKMSNTVLDRAAFELKKDRIARPYVSTAVSQSQGTSMLDFLDNDAALAVCGGWSSVEDMTLLLKEILKPALDDEGYLNQRAFSLFSYYSKYAHEESGIAELPVGTYGYLDSSAAGSQSFERFPGSRIFKLGCCDGEPILAISKAGAVRGYANHFYILPSKGLVLAVMTNTSGVADPSQIVAQYILQETLGLSPPLDHFDDKASEIYTTNQAILSSVATCHGRHLGFSSDEREKLPGRYIEDVTGQMIVISQLGDHELLAYIQNDDDDESSRTSDMLLIKITEATLALSPYTQNLAFDAYHSWKTFGLEMKESSTGTVIALAGIGRPESDSAYYTFKETYKRVETDPSMLQSQASKRKRWAFWHKA